MKYLIVGLGNIGAEYSYTRHNIGFIILDAFAKLNDIVFTPDKLAYKSEFKYKQRKLILIKPTTYMNLSGKAINYWLQKEKVELENLLVICDDIALPLGTLRIKPKGNDGGHNGLADIIDKLGTIEFARLRFGIGNNFPKGKQVDYVLGEFNIEEQNIVNDRIVEVSDIIKSYVTLGLEKTMTIYNKKEYKYKNNKNEI